MINIENTVDKDIEEYSKTTNVYTTEKFTETINGHTYNWTITANKPSIEAIDNLCKLILKIF